MRSDRISECRLRIVPTSSEVLRFLPSLLFQTVRLTFGSIFDPGVGPVFARMLHADQSSRSSQKSPTELSMYVPTETR